MTKATVHLGWQPLSPVCDGCPRSSPFSAVFPFPPKWDESTRGAACGGFFLVHRGFPGKAALIFRKKYSESLNPYAMRFITL
ncbi:hypothetical protein, partial [Aeromonas caviae]|uniref:hypothetical protein n=1 Tax=Aeromonas caviae TaxID=648 RepID=UPI0030D88F38